MRIIQFSSWRPPATNRATSHRALQAIVTASARQNSQARLPEAKPAKQACGFTTVRCWQIDSSHSRNLELRFSVVHSKISSNSPRLDCDPPRSTSGILQQFGEEIFLLLPSSAAFVMTNCIRSILPKMRSENGLRKSKTRHAKLNSLTFSLCEESPLSAATKERKNDSPNRLIKTPSHFRHVHCNITRLEIK
jgi:hypothetical protein